MSEKINYDSSFIGYEHKEVVVKRGMQPVYIDCYPSFGWEFEGAYSAISGITKVVLKFKRNRKLRNKAELSRLQRQFEAGVGEIGSLEESKGLKASVVAYLVGLIGAAFMAGSVFAVTAGNIPLCIILAIPAFAGWILPYFLFRKINSQRILQVDPLIDKKFDEIYEVCERASSLSVD